jgi:hypothetical protein
MLGGIEEAMSKWRNTILILKIFVCQGKYKVALIIPSRDFGRDFGQKKSPNRVHKDVLKSIMEMTR